MYKIKLRTGNTARYTAIFFIVVLAALATGCSKELNTQVDEERPQTATAESASHQPTNGMVQSHEGGAVTIEMEWQGVSGDVLVIDVGMNTHSEELDGYDLMELAVMRDNEGNIYTPVSWDSKPGGHHRGGTLGFPVPASLEQGTIAFIEITISDIASIDERVLKWDFQES